MSIAVTEATVVGIAIFSLRNVYGFAYSDEMEVLAYCYKNGTSAFTLSCCGRLARSTFRNRSRMWMVAFRCLCKSWCFLLDWNSNSFGPRFLVRYKRTRPLDRDIGWSHSSYDTSFTNHILHKLANAGLLFLGVVYDLGYQNLLS